MNNVSSESCKLPADLSYDRQGRVWIRRLADFVILGITHPYLCLIGTPIHVRYPESRSLVRDGYLLVVETRRYYGPVLSPMAGVIIEINSNLLEKPYMIADDPYDNGWIVKVIPEGWDESSFVGAELIRELLRGSGLRCFKHIPDYSISGVGGECPETLSRLSELMARLGTGEKVHLMTDNPRADMDVPAWASVNGFRILERCDEDVLRHFIIGRC
jgi:glycine cleavage system H protein